MAKKILLDTPTGQPTLGYAGIAAAFAGIIANSEPNFAVGIFGGWGAGKTTLMRAIERALPVDGIVSAEFNAWRFEREPQLMVPLLDTIRGVLNDRAERTASALGRKSNADAVARLRRIVERLGRVVRALASGLSASAGIPGAVTVSYDAKTTMDALDALSPRSNSLGPKSLYVAAFEELRSAFADLGQAGINRIVIFVDDLDRCLPGNALEVLESIKLFFDFPGLVFVVGLDERVIDWAIRAKYSAAGIDSASRVIDGRGAAKLDSLSGVGREYAKKIFQIPYSLPVMLPEELDELLDSMYAEAKIEGGQLHDLQERVRPYLEVMAVQRRVNPREVKRFINSYTLQTLIRPDLVPEVILALQTFAFRADWQDMYEAIIASPNHFGQMLKAYRDGESEKFGEGFPGLSEFSHSLKEFLTSSLVQPVIDESDLDPYLSNLRSTSGLEQMQLMRLDLNNWLDDLQLAIREARAKGRSAGRASPVAILRCGNCGTANTSDSQFCMACGTVLVAPEYHIQSIIEAIQLFLVRVDSIPNTRPGPIRALGDAAQSHVMRIAMIGEMLGQADRSEDRHVIVGIVDEMEHLIRDLRSST